MVHHPKTDLTSAELATLWSTYQSDSLALCVFEYFIAKNQDPDTESILLSAYKTSEQHIEFISSIFEEEQIPIPVGFSKEKDVFPGASTIYSDSFFLMYLRQMAKVGMITYSGAVSLTVRKDILEFFQHALQFSSDLYAQSTQASKEKGILIRPPYIDYPEKVEFIKEKSYLSSSLNPFVHRRPLNAVEISHLFLNTETNLLVSMIATSFAQMAESEEVRKFMRRSQEIAQKHLNIFSDALINNDMQAPMSWDTNVKASTEPAFSDKLMMFHTTLISNAGIGNYGMAAAASMRADLALNYFRLILEVAELGKSGADIMITNGWLEEPPQSADRKKLAEDK
ncbi:DUF3231 family protein [Rossellomorea arthrocnemi]|jgi:hypothetical protein|uniref:DUF3231 family protein n=1 Tax=Rossellomorea arthrocnemi TaxID=2769542 RepID=UPI0019186614|nr:DUF3231 family protein [Rossellomorea arthrocnemi]